MKCAGHIVYHRLRSGGYELDEPWWVDTGIDGNAARVFNLKSGVVILELDQFGVLTLNTGYRWDGASGPVIDRPSNMRASLAHDGLYQLLRAGKLDPELRREADAVYRDLLIECGGWAWVAWLDYFGLRLFAGYAARPQREVEDTELEV